MSREEIEGRLAKVVQDHAEYRTTDSESRERGEGNGIYRKERNDLGPRWQPWNTQNTRKKTRDIFFMYFAYSAVNLLFFASLCAFALEL